MTIAYVAPRSASIRLPRIKTRHILIPLAVLLVLYGAMFMRNAIVSQFQIWREDRIVGNIIRHHSHSLKFTVAGHKYEVITPAIRLTDEKRAAWFNYAARHGYPLYAADGPLAIDP